MFGAINSLSICAVSMKKKNLSATPVETGAGETAIIIAFPMYFISTVFHALSG